MSPRLRERSPVPEFMAWLQGTETCAQVGVWVPVVWVLAVQLSKSAARVSAHGRGLCQALSAEASAGRGRKGHGQPSLQMSTVLARTVGPLTGESCSVLLVSFAL